ncbi:hypothetical protein Lser_V15G30322 [Lactuca serriola]
MDEVLVQTTKSRRIRMVERKTRKRSVGKPKTKHLQARFLLWRLLLWRLCINVFVRKAYNESTTQGKERLEA